MSSRTLTFYSTEACHLCEQAAALLASMPELRGHALEFVDIATHDTLLDRYGMLIPVLARGDGAELHWPFNADEVLEWLEGQRDEPG